MAWASERTPLKYEGQLFHTHTGGLIIVTGSKCHALQSSVLRCRRSMKPSRKNQDHNASVYFHSMHPCRKTTKQKTCKSLHWYEKHNNKKSEDAAAVGNPTYMCFKFSLFASVTKMAPLCCPGCLLHNQSHGSCSEVKPQ